MLIEGLIFSLLAITFFVIIFFKIIAKDDTSYIYFLIIQFIGITIGFIEIIMGKSFSNIIKVLSYLFSIIIPFALIILEKAGVNVIEYIYIAVAKIVSIFSKNRAKKTLINLINKYPDSYFGHKMLADIYVSEGGRRKAIDEYVKAIDINKKDYDSYYKIAKLLDELDKKDESIEMLTNLIRKKPEYYKASILLGGLLCEKKKFKEAISIYENALRYDVSNFEIYYNMGIAYTMLNDFKNAKKYYDMAAELNATAYAIYYNLGLLSLMFGDMEEAKKYFYEAIKGTDVEAKGYYHLARICAIKGEKENAINYLNQAIDIDNKLAKKALEDDAFIIIKKYIHIPRGDNKNNELEKYENNPQLEDVEIEKLKLAQEHLERNYEISGNLSKNDLKNMNSFKKERINSREKNIERET